MNTPQLLYGLTTYELILRISVCLAFTIAVGLERQIRHGNTGMRTNVLVGLGSFMFVIISMYIPDASPTRIVAQVVPGIGFLGAGVIMRDGFTVHGLNTAATLWCSAALGTLCAFGLLVPASIGCACVLISNIILRKIIKHTNIRGCVTEDNQVRYIITLNCLKEFEKEIRGKIVEITNNHNTIIFSLASTPIRTRDTVDITVNLGFERLHTQLVEEITFALSESTGVLGVSWDMTLINS